MNSIKLYNRDGADLKLVPKVWELQVDEDHKYILEHMRVGLGEDNKTIEMIDPSGGPYITLGYKLNNEFIIDSIIDVDNSILIHTKHI
jgi:hypothetical protein